MATTIQAEAVSYFLMVDTLALNNRHNLTFYSSGRAASGA
jgi:hypothetical protein